MFLQYYSFYNASNIVIESVWYELFIFHNRIPLFQNNCVYSLALIQKSWLYSFPKHFVIIDIGGLSKNVRHHGRLTKKNLKKYLNIPLSSPRMIQNLTLGNSFSENIISNIQLFKICPQVPVDIIRIFFNFQILQISQTQQKLVKKITHFTTQFRSNNPTHVTNLSSTQLTLKIIC